MKRRTMIVGTAAAAAWPALSAAASPVDAGTRAALTTLLETQAKQWSAGDIEGFCSHYADDCLFLSPGGLTRGRSEVLARYQKKYVDKAAMGTLTLEVIGAQQAASLASVALRWTLRFDDKPPASGLSLVALEKIAAKAGERWLIVHDASM